MGLLQTRTIKTYKCDNCGIIQEWNSSWMSKTIMHNTRGGWDEDITVCSNQCANEFDEKRKRNKKK